MAGPASRHHVRVLRTTLTRAALVAALGAVLGAVLLAAGCRDDQGPLTLQSGGTFIADPLPQGIWSPLRGCLRQGHDQADVMITKVAGTGVETPDKVDLRVAWNPDPADFEFIGKPGLPPVTYRPVTADEHSGGTLSGCSLAIAVALRPGAQHRVMVHGVDVTYVYHGKTYTVHDGDELALCPAGTRSTDRSCR